MTNLLILLPAFISCGILGAALYRGMLRHRFNRKFEEACLRDEPEKAWRYWHGRNEL